MVTGHAIVGTAQFFVIFQVRRALVFRPVTYAFGKNAGKKERMVSDVGSNVEAGVVVRRLQRRQHFKKAVQRFGSGPHDAARVFNPRIFRQHFSHVVRHDAVFDAGTFEHVANEHVKIKVS